MQDSTVIERWNPISLAEMAVGVKGVLYRVINHKQRPYDFEESLENGIEFLDEASNGGAIICGETPQTGFTGTLEPLTFTARHINIETENLEEPEFYKKVVETLREYKNVLLALKQNPGNQNLNIKSLYEFFNIISCIAMKEADPTSKSISKPMQ